jgi:UDP-glucose 4-epimerase
MERGFFEGFGSVPGLKEVKGMPILVTGGAGYIGVHTCVELLNAGYEIVVMDNFTNSKPEALRRVKEITNKNFPIYEGDLLDKKCLFSIFSENKIDAVIHLAGLKAVGESATIPIQYYINNVAGTLSLLETMQHFKLKRLVFSSSATVYGQQSQPPISENVPLSATNTYGRTKLIAEEILSDLFNADKEWSIALLRYFNPIGAHQSGRIGEHPNGIPNNLMPYITQVAVGKLKVLKIFGGNYPTQDGTGVRDYIHVVDLALGHIKALDKVLAVSGLDAYNLGTGQGISVLELVKNFEKVSTKKIPYEIANRRLGDVATCYADPTKASKELDWAASKDIEDMCIDAWRWQVHNPNGYEEVSERIQLINSRSDLLMK